jgi:hypothetical protein
MRLIVFVCRVICSCVVTASLFVSCSAQKTCLNCGSVLFKTRIFNSQTKEFETAKYSRDRMLWYKDSLIIAELFRVNIVEDPYGQEKWDAVVYGYTFIDLRTRSFYDYASFSDTARILDKYVQPDTGRVKGGWNFFDDRVVIYRENMESLPDTIIEGITYKRVKSFNVFKTENGEEKVLQFGYFRCDKRNSFFFVDRLLSKQLGCPLIRDDYINVAKQIWLSHKIEFLNKKLTSEEIKVFNAWEQNAKKNPVTK